MTGGAPATAERTQAPFGRRAAVVRERARFGAYTVLRCADPGGPAPDPGQFYMLAAAERWGGGADGRPFLARAFSVLRAAPGTVEFLLEDVGPGTTRLGELDAGDELLLVGPLGIGFRAPADSTRRLLLVGGGVGIAPLVIWDDWLLARGPAPAPPEILLGFRDASHAAGAELFDPARTRLATDDGSTGHRGRVTELLTAGLAGDAHAVVYACGPPPMLEAVRAICAARGVPAQLALESGMACGYGACFGCAVPTREGLVRLCVDGPVLDADRLLTALVPGAGH